MSSSGGIISPKSEDFTGLQRLSERDKATVLKQKVQELKEASNKLVQSKKATFEKYTNQHLVVNPFKPSEDPYGLATKRILTKENIRFVQNIYAKASRLQCLDPVVRPPPRTLKTLNIDQQN